MSVLLKPAEKRPDSAVQTIMPLVEDLKFFKEKNIVGQDLHDVYQYVQY